MGKRAATPRYRRVMTENANIWSGMLTHLLRAVVAFAVLIAVACFSSCRCPECVTTSETERIVEVRTHDTTIVTEADSASIRALFRCDSAYNVVMYELVTMQGERIEASVNAQKHGKDLAISLDCKEDSLLTEIQLRDSIINTTTHNTTIVRERYVPNYYKSTSRGFWVLFVILLLIVAWWGFKIYRKIVTGQVVWRL